MLAERQNKASIGIGLGLGLEVVGRVLHAAGQRGAAADDALTTVAGLVTLVGVGTLVWGCAQLSAGKGYSPWLGVLGLAGCLGPLILVVLGDRYPTGMLSAPPSSDRLNYLLGQFVSGTDRSSAQVRRIETELHALSPDDDRYADLSRAAASFQPGGEPPFYDELRLAEAFRAFLQQRQVFVPEHGQVWPPPPSERPADERAQG